MGFGAAIKSGFDVFKKLVSGRSCRSEYWFWHLFQFLVSFALQLVYIIFVVVPLLTSLSNSMGNSPTPHTFTNAPIPALSPFAMLFVLFVGIVGSLYTIITFAPTLAFTIRRLHDTNKSGWWSLLGFIPIAGWLVLLIWFCTKGTTGPNRFGPDPLGHPGFDGPMPDAPPTELPSA